MSGNETIRFSTDAMEEIVAQLKRVQSEILSQKSQMSAICSSIEKQSGAELELTGGSASLHCGAKINSGQVKSMLGDYERAFAACANGAKSLSGAVSRASSLFEEKENELLKRFEGIGVSSGSSFNVGNAAQGSGKTSSILDSAKEKVKSWVENWKTGAKIIKGKFDECVSAFAKDWEAKGMSYRIIKGLGAVVNIVAGTATTACAILGTGITAGTSAPITVLIGAYGANTAASGIADLYNCITGNVDQIGEVDLLKTGLTKIGGQVGEWLGNRKAGETVGEVAYIAGGLTTAVVSIKNLAGQIKQSATAGNTLRESYEATKKIVSGAYDELSGAIKNVGYIATQCDVRDLSYQFHMLSKEVPNICKVVSEVKLIEKGVSSGKKLIDAGGKIVNTLAGWEMVKQPTFFNTAEQVSHALPVSSNVISEIQSGIEGISLDKVKDGIKNIQEVFAIAF